METEFYDRALGYTSASLKILPEDPLLLVSVADLQARRGLFDLAEKSSRQVLDELDRFLPPASLPEQNWPELKKQFRASCCFALGRAEVSEALAISTPAARDARLQQALDDLSRVREYNSLDAEIPYLAGLAYLSLNNAEPAAAQFAAAYRLGGPLEAKVLQQLKRLYDISTTGRAFSFEKYMASLPDPKPQASLASPVRPSDPLPGYAGSEACRQCHPDIYQQWARTPAWPRCFAPTVRRMLSATSRTTINTTMTMRFEAKTGWPRLLLSMNSGCLHA
jgi:hypothetical protein